MIMTDKDNLKYMKFLFLFLFIILSFYRSPFIFLNGRFLAEEATSHFVFALQNNFFENLSPINLKIKNRNITEINCKKYLKYFMIFFAL